MSGTDQNCNLELNKQLQGLSARLDQAENNIVAQYTATATTLQNLAESLISVPGFTLGAFGTDLSTIFSGEFGGFEILQKLVDSISMPDFKKLTMAMASGLLSTMASELEALESGAINAIGGLIATTESLIVGAESTLATAATALESAIVGGVAAEIAAAQNEYNNAKQILSNLKDLLTSHQNSLASLPGFLKAQADIGKCKSMSVEIG